MNNNPKIEVEIENMFSPFSLCVHRKRLLLFLSFAVLKTTKKSVNLCIGFDYLQVKRKITATTTAMIITKIVGIAFYCVNYTINGWL